MDSLEIGLTLVFAVAVVGALSKKVPIPLPLLQVICGFLLSFLPGFQNLLLDPGFFFAFFIPPLLFADGWLIPKRDLARVLRPVLLLALGLVIFTVVVVGYLIHYLIPAIPLAAAFALGAIISPTDAVAVSAITEKLKMPNRLTHIVQGESLINDASGLVAFKFAVAAVLTGTFSVQTVSISFLIISVGGGLVGFLISWLIGATRVWLVRGKYSEPTIETILSLLSPYAAYFAAEQLQVSGILAVVSAGIYAGIHDTRNLTTETRRQTWEVWNTLLFSFNGLVFILLGIQLNRVIEGISDFWFGELFIYAMVLSATVILVRIIWVFPGAYIPRWLFKGIRAREKAPELRHVFILGWAGIRGSVTLAAALSLPLSTAGGLPFPGRSVLLFLASSVIIVTMVFNGLTLPLLLRWLKISGDGISEKEELEARIAVAQAAILRIQQHVHPLSSPYEQGFAADLISFYERKIQHLTHQEIDQNEIKTELKIERNIRFNALDAERQELFNLHKKKKINEEVLRNIQRDIDNLESGLGALTVHDP